MAYLKFLDSKKMLPCKVSLQGNIVTLKFLESIVVDTSGFNVYLDSAGEMDIGGNSYHGFTTIYRNDDETTKYNGYQLSNDGSVWVEPKPEPEIPEPEPYVPTLEETQEMKIAEMNTVQQSVIQAGIDVELSSGVEHFTLTDHDQTSLMGLQSQVAVGEENIPWHTSNEAEHCKFYSNADMQLIITAAMSYVTWHVTYFRDLRIYIRSLQSKEVVEAVTYGINIPEEYMSEPLKAMIAAQST